MTKSSEFLVGVFGDVCKRYGFRKKGLVWCKRSEETLSSFELQKSNYGDLYFINVGVFFLRLEDGGEHRPPHKCHFYGRFGDEMTLKSLDFETDAVGDRSAILSRFRDDMLVPVMLQCSTEKGSIAFFSSGALSTPLVLPKARPILGLGSVRE